MDEIEKLPLVQQAIKNVEKNAEKLRLEQESKKEKDQRDMLMLSTNQNWSQLDFERNLKA